MSVKGKQNIGKSETDTSLQKFLKNHFTKYDERVSISKSTNPFFFQQDMLFLYSYKIYETNTFVYMYTYEQMYVFHIFQYIYIYKLPYLFQIRNYRRGVQTRFTYLKKSQ